MANYKSEDIRNFVLTGHGGTGKTTLAEAMLFNAKATTRFGKIADGTSVSDYEKDEHERQFSIDLSVLNCDWNKKHFIISDVPGYLDFMGNLVAGLAAADLAVLVISAVSGVQVGTRQAWKRIQELGIPCVIVLNRMDGENANFANAIDSIRSIFGTQCAPMTVPVGEGSEFSGVVNLLGATGEVPAAAQDFVDQYRSDFIESIVEADDDLMERYMEDDEIKPEELRGVFSDGIRSGSVVPILVSAAEKEIGVNEIMDCIAEYGPTPADAYKRKVTKLGTEDEVELTYGPDGNFCAQVFKTKSDPYVGKVNYIRVLSGTAKSGGQVVLSSTGKAVSVGNFLKIQGKDQKDAPEIVAGDIVAIAKVENLSTNDTVSSSANKLMVEPIKFPTPMVSLAVEPKSRGDEAKLNPAFRKIADEDPTFTVERRKDTKETVISGMGSLHLEILLARMIERYGVEVTTKPPKIAYLETITAKAEGHHRHKKQSGGAGQFAEVYFRIEPNERGAGIEFSNDIFGGAITDSFAGSSEKGARAKLEEGILAGYIATDIKVSIYDGKMHPVDSKDIAFQTAGRKAIADAFMKAKPTLLEPIVKLEVMVPVEFMGDISGDLSTRRARITGTDMMGDMQVIKADVPLGEVANYSNELRSMTSGAGTYTVEFSHYEDVPSNVVQQIVAKHKKELEENQK